MKMIKSVGIIQLFESSEKVVQSAYAIVNGWACQECGHKFKTVSAAERAQNDGCPKCGGSDIDLAP